MLLKNGCPNLESGKILFLFRLSASSFPTNDTTNSWAISVFAYNMSTILLIILILLLIGAFPAWPYSTGWGYFPSGSIGLVLLIILILALSGRI